MASTPVANGHKSKKQSKIIVLRLSPSNLGKFITKNESSSSASSPKTGIEDEMPTLKPALSQDPPSESNSTPAPMQDGASSTANGKKKGPGAGIKRGPTLTVDGLPKPRGKPGPKKKPRLEDGTIDHSAKPANAGTANPKLGPKANTGNINANLRALDRSGNPCRKWDRKGFQIKSFTGVVWELSSWKGGEKLSMANGASDVNGNEISMQESSDMKPSESDTAQGSTAGEHPDRMDISTPAASSPAPIQATPVIAAQS